MEEAGGLVGVAVRSFSWGRRVSNDEELFLNPFLKTFFFLS